MAIPGVPNLLRNAPRAIGITLLGTAVSGLFNLLFPAPKWGIFIRGSENSDVSFSGINAVDIAADSQASDYPIQTGSFTSYNKMARPNIFRVEIARDGSAEERELLLKWLEKNVGEPTLFDVVVPERRWANATLVSYRISRSARSGAAMLLVDCIFQQVRELPAAYSRQNIADPENEPTTPAARVNPQPTEPNSAGGQVSWQ